MKRYLFFQTPDSDFELETPQFVLCGNPRIVALSPLSNASTFLWEQIEPNPTLFPVTITPNNTTKNITVGIPVNTPSPIVLKVTLNGVKEEIITVNTSLEDIYNTISRGGYSSFTSTNTLNNPVNYLFVPLPSLGPQVVQLLSNGSTSIKLLNQSYRNNLLRSVNLTDVLANTSQEINYVMLMHPYTTDDIRVSVDLNKPYTIEKNWARQEVFSQDNITANIIFTTNTPLYIADEYNLTNTRGTFSRFISSRLPFTVQSQSFNDVIYSTNNIFIRGTFNRFTFTRLPFSNQTLSNQEIYNSNTLSKGTQSRMIITRIPFSSNVIGG